MLDNISFEKQSAFAGSVKHAWAHQTNRYLLEKMESFAREHRHTNIGRHTESIVRALGTNHCVVAIDRWNRMVGLSLALPQGYDQRTFEIAFKALSAEHERFFLSEIVSRRQVTQIKRTYPDTFIYTVVGAASEQLDVLLDDNWQAFPPERAQRSARSETGGKFLDGDVWLHPPKRA